MKRMAGLLAVCFLLVPITARAELGWSRYHVDESGTSVDIPRAIFSEPAGKPEGYGERFRSPDSRADITVQSAPRRPGDTPSSFLAKLNPPSQITYRRITPRFFVVSSVRRDRIWYDRCNFTAAFVHCVLVNYPAEEKRRWDGIITRISYSLSGR